MKSRGLKKGVAMGLIFFGVLAVAALFEVSPLLDSMNRKLTNGLYKGRQISEEIVLVAIDDESQKPLEMGGLGLFPTWGKKPMAEVIENLRKNGAHSIFMDVIYNSPSRSISFEDLNSLVQEAKTPNALGKNLFEYVDGVHPDDQALAESMGDDVFLLELFEGQSFELIRNLAQVGYSQLRTSENEQTVYSMRIGRETENGFDESLAPKMARDFLYRDDRTAGSFDGDFYHFDEQRNIPLLNDDQMLINYAAPSYRFKMISFVDVLNGDFQPSEVEGKMVLIGATSAILQDRHFTPIDPNIPMPGVEIQANAIQTILDGAFLKPQSFGGFLAMVSMMVLVSVGVFVLAPVWTGAGLLVLEIAAFPFFAQFMFNRGVIVNLVWPVFALVACYLASLAYRYLTEFKERRRVQAAFGHYVSPDLVEEIMKHPDVLKLYEKTLEKLQLLDLFRMPLGRFNLLPSSF